MTARLSAQHERADGPHQKTRAEGHQRKHQRREFAPTWEKSARDCRRVVSEDLEIVHLQRIPAGDADHGPESQCAGGLYCGHRFG